MRIGSLFSGIGGLELGLERAIPGAHTVFQVEQDPYARAVLAKHWPNAQRYEDVRQVGAHNLPPCDLLCGGFPCQDISQAGKQAGIDGERSGLWAEYARIIGELRDAGRPPRYIVVENVAALLTGGMGRVLGDLAACGYDAIWDCIPAAAVGAPHRRDRIFIVAHANRSPRSVGGERLHRQTPPRKPSQRSEDQGLANPDSTRLEGHRKTRDARQVCPQETARLFSRSLGHITEWELEPPVGRVATGVPRRVDRLRCLGNAVVPQVAEVVGRVVLQLEEGSA